MILTAEQLAYKKQMLECSEEEFLTWYATGMRDVFQMRGSSHQDNCRRIDWEAVMMDILRERLHQAASTRRS